MSEGKDVNTMDSILFHGPGAGVKGRSRSKHVVYKDMTIIRFDFRSWIYFKN